MLEGIVARVYDGIDDAPISVAFSADEFPTSFTDPASLLLPGEAEVLRDDAVRRVTSYPDFEECLEIFNEQVRHQLLSELRRDMGEATHLPLKMCMLAMLPTFLFSIATTFLACDGLPCDVAPKEQGFQSRLQMWTCDALGLCLIIWPGFQSMFPLLLRVLGSALSSEAGFQPLNAGSCVMVWLSGLGLYMYLFLLMGLANALLMITVTRPPSLPWLAGFGATAPGSVSGISLLPFLEFKGYGFTIAIEGSGAGFRVFKAGAHESKPFFFKDPGAVAGVPVLGLLYGQQFRFSPPLLSMHLQDSER